MKIGRGSPRWDGARDWAVEAFRSEAYGEGLEAALQRRGGYAVAQ